MVKNEYSNSGMQQYEKVGPILICDVNIAVMTDNRYLPILYIFHYHFDTFGRKTGRNKYKTNIDCLFIGK